MNAFDFNCLCLTTSNFWATDGVFSVFTIGRISYMNLRTLIEMNAYHVIGFLMGIESEAERGKETHRSFELFEINGEVARRR